MGIRVRDLGSATGLTGANVIPIDRSDYTYVQQATLDDIKTYVGSGTGTSGTSGNGTSGKNGTSGTSAVGTSGTSGIGTSGTSGTSSIGTSGTSGKDGTFLGSSGTSGMGSPGTSGTSGNGTSGISGTSGKTGTSGSSGTTPPYNTDDVFFYVTGTTTLYVPYLVTSGITIMGTGISMTSGTSGKNGTSGVTGNSGTSGITGTSGTSGNGTSGTSGKDGTAGTAGVSPTYYTDSLLYYNTGTTTLYSPYIVSNSIWSTPLSITVSQYNTKTPEYQTLVSTLNWLSGNMSGATTILLTDDVETINTPITINLPYDLAIKGGAYGQNTLKAGTGLANSPMFTINSNVSFVKMIFDANGTTGNTCLYVPTNNLYIEFKDSSIDGGFLNGIYSTSNSEFWVFEAVLNNCRDSGFKLNTTSSGARYRSTLVDYSCSSNYNYTGINLLSGDTIYISTENDTTELIHTGQTFIKKGDNTSTTYSDFFVFGALWNSTGNFKSGFDFTRSDGRDADIVMISNVGEESQMPHAKLGWESNSGTTTTSVQNTWYKLSLYDTPNAINYVKKFTSNGNKLTFQPTHTKDALMWISGSILPDANTVTTWQLAIVKNGNTGTTYGRMQVTTDAANRTFGFSTNVYISDVTKNDYFEIFIRNTSNNTVVIRANDINWLIDTR